MSRRFSKHYSRDEARALLPQVRDWLTRLAGLRAELEKQDLRFGGRLAAGEDLGGPSVKAWLEHLVSLQETLQEFQKREIQIKDLDRGLIDFPALLAGKEVFLCWEQGEEDIEFWHELEAGYAGRHRL